MDRAELIKANTVNWKLCAITVLQVWVVFCVATFSMAIYFTHLQGSSLVMSGLMVALFLFVIVGCVVRLAQRLPMAAVMLLVPIAPLAILLMVVSLLPIVQRLA